MVNCHEMKNGEVYTCDSCGLELKVVKECREAGVPPEKCQCPPCTFVCCGAELQKKS